MLVSLAPQTMKYELCLNGLLLSDILPYPLFHCHVRLPVIRVCFAVCLMSHSFRYPQLTASGYLNLASVIAGPNTCGLTIVATMQHETLGSHIHVKWLAPNVCTYIYIYIYDCTFAENFSTTMVNSLRPDQNIYFYCNFPVCSTENKSVLVQVMFYSQTGGNHYLNQCWPRPMTLCDVAGS